MENCGGSAVNGLKVEEKIGWGVLTLCSGGKRVLTVEGATLWVLKSGPGLTEFPKSWEGGGRVGRGRGRGRGRVVVTSWPPWPRAAASTSAFTRGTLPSGLTSGPEKTGGLMGSS